MGETVLHVAARNENREVILYYLSLGADINAQDYRGQTALHAAGRLGRKGMYDFLIEHGADEEIADDSGIAGKRWKPVGEGIVELGKPEDVK